MFFILSKILSILISPFLWIVISIAFAVFLKSERCKRLFLILAISFFFFFSNGFVFRSVIGWWEGDLVPLSSFDGKTDYCVVLGGLSSQHEASGRVCFSQASDRLWQALHLHQKGYVKKLVFSGGSAAIIHQQMAEAIYLKEFLFGVIADSSFLIEAKSRNTFENAYYTSLLFDSIQAPKHIILVTSAFHMPRAKRCFQKQGFVVFPLTTQPLKSTQPLTIGEMVIPSLSVLNDWNIMLREWVGLMIYRWKGFL